MFLSFDICVHLHLHTCTSAPAHLHFCTCTSAPGSAPSHLHLDLHLHLHTPTLLHFTEMDPLRYKVSVSIKKKLSSPRWSKSKGRLVPQVLKSGPSIELKQGDATGVKKFEDKDRRWVVIYCMDRGFGEGELGVIADNALLSPQVKGIYIYIHTLT